MLAPGDSFISRFARRRNGECWAARDRLLSMGAGTGFSLGAEASRADAHVRLARGGGD